MVKDDKCQVVYLTHDVVVPQKGFLGYISQTECPEFWTLKYVQEEIKVIKRHQVNSGSLNILMNNHLKVSKKLEI